MNFDLLETLLSRLHSQAKASLPALKRKDEAGAEFATFDTGQDRYYPRHDFTGSGRHDWESHSSHTVMEALVQKEAAMKTFKDIIDLLRSHPLLDDPTRLVLTLGLSKMGKPSFKLSIENIDAHGKDRLVTLPYLMRRIKEAFIPLDALAAVIEKTPLHLYRSTSISTIVAAPTPEAAELKIRCLLLPEDVLKQEHLNLGPMGITLYLDEDKTLDRAADLTRLLLKKETP